MSIPLENRAPKKNAAMVVPIYHVNAFTRRPFAGNPAAVCLLGDMPGADWMQDVAAQTQRARA